MGNNFQESFEQFGDLGLNFQFSNLLQLLNNHLSSPVPFEVLS